MSGGRGAGDRPLTYAGEYDATRTYLAREVVTSGGSVFMAIALTTGHAPPNTTYWLPLGGGGGASVTPGGQRVVDIVWPTNQNFVASGVGVGTATGWSPSSGTDAATATTISGTQILLCTDDVPALYHLTFEPNFFLHTSAGAATQFAVSASMPGWFDYVIGGPPPGTSATDLTRYTFSGFKYCTPGQAVNADDLVVKVLDDWYNTYRVPSDNAAMTLTRMPA